MYKYITILIMLFLIGCNVLNQPKQEEKAPKLPLKIATYLPAFLYPSSTKKIRQYYYEDETIGIGKVSDTFEFTKDYISLYLTIEEIMRTNNKIVNQIFDIIQKKCQNTPLNQICQIQASKIEYTFHQPFIDQLKQQMNILSDIYIKDKENVSFGQIEFITYTKQKHYDYMINIDITETMKKFYDEENLSKAIQSTSWIKDDNRVLSTIYIEFSEQEKTSYTINFEHSREGEKMYLYVKNFDALNTQNDIHNLFITNYYDNNKTAEVTFNGLYTGEDILTEDIRYASFVKTYLENGLQVAHLKTKTAYNQQLNYISNEIINTQGILKATTFCFSISEICEMDNPESWFISTKNLDIFSPVKAYNDIYKVIDLSQIALKNGSYFYIPTSLYHDKMSIDEVLLSKVGEFVVLNSNGYGIWNDSKYSSQQDLLTLLYATYNESLTIPLHKREKGYFQKIKSE